MRISSSRRSSERDNTTPRTRCTWRFIQTKRHSFSDVGNNFDVIWLYARPSCRIDLGGGGCFFLFIFKVKNGERTSCRSFGCTPEKRTTHAEFTTICYFCCGVGFTLHVFIIYATPLPPHRRILWEPLEPVLSTPRGPRRDDLSFFLLSNSSLSRPRRRIHTVCDVTHIYICVYIYTGIYIQYKLIPTTPYYVILLEVYGNVQGSKYDDDSTTRRTFLSKNISYVTTKVDTNTFSHDTTHTYLLTPINIVGTVYAVMESDETHESLHRFRLM